MTDLLVMTDVVRRLHQPAKLDWSRPPLWAAEWSVNTALIVPIGATSPGAGPVSGQAVSPQAPAASAGAPAPASTTRSLGLMLP